MSDTESGIPPDAVDLPTRPVVRGGQCVPLIESPNPTRRDKRSRSSRSRPDVRLQRNQVGQVHVPVVIEVEERAVRGGWLNARTAIAPLRGKMIRQIHVSVTIDVTRLADVGHIIRVAIVRAAVGKVTFVGGRRYGRSQSLVGVRSRSAIQRGRRK